MFKCFIMAVKIINKFKRIFDWFQVSISYFLWDSLVLFFDTTYTFYFAIKKSKFGV